MILYYTNTEFQITHAALNVACPVQSLESITVILILLKLHFTAFNLRINARNHCMQLYETFVYETRQYTKSTHQGGSRNHGTNFVIELKKNVEIMVRLRR